MFQILKCNDNKNYTCPSSRKNKQQFQSNTSPIDIDGIGEIFHELAVSEQYRNFSETTYSNLASK